MAAKKTIDDVQGDVGAPAAARIYGAVVYWLSIAACFLCTVAPIWAVALPERNFLNPYVLFTRMWEKLPPERLWDGAASPLSDAWFWTRNITYGDGLMMLGLVLGCACAGVGLLGSAVAYAIGRKPEPVWAIGSLLMAAAIILAMSGLLA